MSALELQNVRKEFAPGIVPVKDVSLTVHEGEFLALLGPSGCGKSTLLRMIAGLEEVTSGDIRINGNSVAATPAAKRNIAMVFQSYALYPHMTVSDNIGSSLRLRKVPASEIKKRVHEVAEKMGVTGILNKKPAQLSGGQRQRVAVARALVRDPEVFLLDEPLSNLDALLREKVRAELVALFRQQGKPVVYVTHDQTEAMTMADRIIILNQGVVQQLGTPEEIYTRPGNRFVAEFIGSPRMNIVELTRQEDGYFLGTQNIQTPFSDQGPETLQLGIRPEHLHLVTNGNKPHIQGRVEHVEDHGREHLLTVQLCTTDTQLRFMAPRSSYKLKQEIGLEIYHQGMHFFCTNSGKLLT